MPANAKRRAKRLAAGITKPEAKIGGLKVKTHTGIPNGHALLFSAPVRQDFDFVEALIKDQQRQWDQRQWNQFLLTALK